VVARAPPSALRRPPSWHPSTPRLPPGGSRKSTLEPRIANLDPGSSRSAHEGLRFRTVSQLMSSPCPPRGHLVASMEARSVATFDQMAILFRRSFTRSLITHSHSPSRQLPAAARELLFIDAPTSIILDETPMMVGERERDRWNIKQNEQMLG